METRGSLYYVIFHKGLEHRWTLPSMWGLLEQSPMDTKGRLYRSLASRGGVEGRICRYWWQQWLEPSRVYAPSAPSMPWASLTRPSTQPTFVVYMTSRLLKHSILGLPVHLSPIPPYPHSKALEHLLVGNSGPSVISKSSASTAHNV